jgi:adenylate kinase family enzyme
MGLSVMGDHPAALTGEVWPRLKPIMQRVAIMGCSGGGKSTVARALGRKLGLPVVHLDALYWLPGWVERDKSDFRTLQTQALAGERWVVDGGYASTLDLRLPRADTIIVIDQPMLLCLWRVTWRWLTHLGRTRADMGEACPEKVDWEFVRFIWDYPKATWPKQAEGIAAMGGHARLIRLTSDRQIAEFLADIPAGSGAI